MADETLCMHSLWLSPDLLLHMYDHSFSRVASAFRAASLATGAVEISFPSEFAAKYLAFPIAPAGSFKFQVQNVDGIEML